MKLTEFLTQPSFFLPSEFVRQFSGLQPEWGPLGYVTYKRTYAREKENGLIEEWFETVERVVNSCFSIQKNHCDLYTLPWNEEKAQASAQKMFQKIWDFKFLPPGRGLWAMGTKTLSRIGSACINNCTYISTNIPDQPLDFPFTYVMDHLMLGVGVGFDTDGVFPVHGSSEKNEIFLVPDSREGWIQALSKMLRHFFYNEPLPVYDFSLIRPKGAPIKGFGGVASGFEPLREMLTSVQEILMARRDSYLTTSDIVDICNHIGKCVVAGNIRRSALIAIGDKNDSEFIHLKRDLEKLISHRWSSNNSIVTEIGDDLSYISDCVATNGEPGLLWRENFSKGRIGDHLFDIKDNARGVNPCIPSYSKFLTKDKGILPLSELSIGDMVWTGFNWAPVSKIWSTGTKSVYRYTTSGGHTIDCTEDHKLYTKDGKVEAKDAENVLVNPATFDSFGNFSIEAIIAGLIQGDGSKQKNGGKSAYLNVGIKDSLYYKDLLSDYIDKVIEKTNDHCELYKMKLDFSHYNIDYAPLPQRIISDHWMSSSLDDRRSFLRGLFSANGSVIKGKRIALKTTNRTLASQVQLLLSSVGIKSYITTNKSKSVIFANGEYTCKESYDINTNQTDLFMKLIGFIQDYKTVELKEKDLTKNHYPINSSEFIGDMEVFDFTIDAPEHSAWVNGVIISNCAEITLESGELCNLVEIYPSRHDSLEVYPGSEIYETLKLAYLYAKTVTLIPSHCNYTNQVMLRNRRIGCSLTGITNSFKKFTKTKFLNFCDEGYSEIRRLDKVYSSWLGVPTSIKVTTVKPSGTVSLLPPGINPGIHYPISEYYIRRMRVAKDTPIHKALLLAGYHIEQDVTQKDTVVVSFPVKDPHFLKGESDVSIWEQLLNTAALQRYWADNSVSVTIKFKESEIPELQSAIETFADKLKTVSFLPSAPGSYAQMPLEATNKETYEQMLQQIDPDLLYQSLSVYSEEGDGGKSYYCESDKCELPSN